MKRKKPRYDQLYYETVCKRLAEDARLLMNEWPQLSDKGKREKYRLIKASVNELTKDVLGCEFGAGTPMGTRIEPFISELVKCSGMNSPIDKMFGSLYDIHDYYVYWLRGK